MRINLQTLITERHEFARFGTTVKNPKLSIKYRQIRTIISSLLLYNNLNAHNTSITIINHRLGIECNIGILS